MLQATDNEEDIRKIKSILRLKGKVFRIIVIIANVLLTTLKAWFFAYDPIFKEHPVSVLSSFVLTFGIETIIPKILFKKFPLSLGYRLSIL